MGVIQRSLQKLCSQYMSGEFDVISPVSVLRDLVDCEPSFGSGEQHDAQECLSIFCGTEATGIADAFCASHGGAEHGGVLLCELGVDARVSGLAAPVNLNALIISTLTGDRALATAPKLLLLRIENIYEELGEQYFVDAKVDLSMGVYDLAGCIAGDRPTTRYTVRGYVQHRHGLEPPANGMACGHYVAYCRRGDAWFCADDASVAVGITSGDIPFFGFLVGAH